MGMYTELVLGINLKESPPKEVVDTISYMITGNYKPAELPKHMLFEIGHRWEYMLRCSSYYFAGDTHSTIRYDKIGRFWTISIRCSLKNYSNEIDLFWDWIKPYCEPRGFAGYSRYEEDREPTLLYLPEEIYE